MRIGVDARILSETKTGLHNFVFYLLTELQKIDQQNSYYLLSHQDIDFPLKNERWHKIIGDGLTTRISKLWLQTQLPRLIKDKSLDIFWGTCNLLPLALNRRIKKLLTVHDLTYLFFPETMAIKNLIAYRFLQKKSITRADKILADSQATADDLQKHFALTVDKIEVVYPGIDNTLFQNTDTMQIKEVVKKYQINLNYILAVSTIEPRKNLESLLKAYAILLKRHNIVHQLVIVGAKGWKDSGLYKQVKDLELGNRVRFLGFVPHRDLPVLYSGACVFLYLSLYEGFGFPILEAMACGCPVITSNVSSMPEVAADVAVLVDCQNIEQIAHDTFKLINNQAQRNLLKAKGRERVKQFSWTDRAHQLLNIFARLMKI